MKLYEYNSRLTFVVEAFSQKDADRSFKPVNKTLAAFCTAFGISLSVSEGIAQTDIPYRYRFFYECSLTVRIPPRHVLSLADAIRLFADLNKLEVSDESCYGLDDEY